MATDTEPKLTRIYAMHPVRSTSPTLDASSWTLDMRASSHMTGERRSITSDYAAYAPGEHQVKLGEETVVDVAGIGTAVIRTWEN